MLQTIPKDFQRLPIARGGSMRHAARQAPCPARPAMATAAAGHSPRRQDRPGPDRPQRDPRADRGGRDRRRVAMRSLLSHEPSLNDLSTTYRMVVLVALITLNRAPL